MSDKVLTLDYISFLIVDCIVYWSTSVFWYEYLWYEYRCPSLCSINDSVLDEWLIAEQQFSIPYLLPFTSLHIQTHHTTQGPGVYHLELPPDIWRNGAFRRWTVRRHYFTISGPSHSTLSNKFTSPQQATALLTLSETHHTIWLCTISVIAHASALSSPASTCDPNSCLLSCVIQTINWVPLQIGLLTPEHKVQN